MKKAATKAEREHMATVAGLGCIACHNMGIPDSPAEIHHIRSGMGMGQRNSHWDVIPLCFHHHSAQGEDGFHKHPKTFQARHGTETELKRQVDDMLERVAIMEEGR